MTTKAQSEAKPLVEALRGVLCHLADPNAVLRAILEQAVTLTRAGPGPVHVEVLERGELAFRVLHGFEPKHLEGEAGGFSRQVFQRVLASGNEVMLANALDDPFYGASRPFKP